MGHVEVSAVHVLLSIARHRSSARGLLDAAGADHGTVRAALIARRPGRAGGRRLRELPWSGGMEVILRLSQSLTRKYFTSTHLLGLILDHDEECVGLLEGCGVRTAALRAAVAVELG